MGKEPPRSVLSKAKKKAQTFSAIWAILFAAAGYLILDHFKLLGLDGVDKNEMVVSALIVFISFGLYLLVATRESVEALMERNKKLDPPLNEMLPSVKELVERSDAPRKSLDEQFLILKVSLAELNGDVRRISDEHERIMFPNAAQPKRHVVGVDDYEGTLPPARPRPTGPNSKWRITYSVLRYRWLQDLLFNHAYLEHVVRSKNASSEEHKLLIIDGVSRHNGQHPHDVAVKGYISLTAALGIKTYLVTEYEYEGFLRSIPDVLGDSELAGEVQKLMEGHPELSYNKADFCEVVKDRSDDCPRTLLFRHKDNPTGKYTSDNIAAIAAVNLFLENFVATGGDDETGRLCKDDGEDALKRARSETEIWQIDDAHCTQLKSQWQTTVAGLEPCAK